MKKIVVSIVLIFFYSCLHKNKQNSFIDSPSKKYYIASKVNNAEVIIHLYDFKGLLRYEVGSEKEPG